MSLVSSQGQSIGVTGARKITVKKTRPKPGANKLDASTLAIPHGGKRVYEDGLPDNGPNGSTNGGITTTIAVEFKSASKPAVGSTVTRSGVTLKCIDSELTDDAGTLKQGTANYTSDYTD
jgi:hypothetical protein